MPSKRTQFRTLPFLIILGLMIVLIPPPSRAAASSELPFELLFPQEVTETVFSSTFGAGRSGGRRHKGNDLMAPKMTEVYAAADGVVETIKVSRNAGRYLTIDHADGWSTTYMHLNNDNPYTDDGSADWSLTVVPGIEEGTHVFAGQLIGYVGDSGNAEWTGSHTHFELRYNGVAVNPYSDLVAAAERAIAGAEHLWRLASPLDPDQMS